MGLPTPPPSPQRPQGGGLGARNSDAALAGACVGPAQASSEQEPEITQLKLLMPCADSL